MIYIEDGDVVLLPQKFHKLHNICVDLHDLMLSLGKDDAYKKLLVTNFPLSPEEKLRFAEAKGKGIESVLDYLSSNGRKDLVVTALAKNVFCAVLGDFLSFIYESLSCARNRKMSVAFNLLRKPLTDELLLLEQLLVDREDFIDRFHFKGDPNHYDPSGRNLGADRIKQIIALANEKLGALSSFFNESVFEFRYDKTQAAGLYWIMNHAHHIVTADKNYKTQDRNLNFVFSNDTDFDRYWKHYYQVLPYMLVYCSSIMDAIAHEFIDINEEDKALRELKRFLSLAYWTEEIETPTSKETKFIEALKIPEIQCGECSGKTTLIPADFKLYFDTGQFVCPNCFALLLDNSDLKSKLATFFSSDSKGAT